MDGCISIIHNNISGDNGQNPTAIVRSRYHLIPPSQINIVGPKKQTEYLIILHHHWHGQAIFRTVSILSPLSCFTFELEQFYWFRWRYLSPEHKMTRTGCINQTERTRRWSRGEARDIAICGSLTAQFNFKNRC